MYGTESTEQNCTPIFLCKKKKFKCNENLDLRQPKMYRILNN